MSALPSGTSTVHRGSVSYSFLARGYYARCDCGWESTWATDTAQEAADKHTDHIWGEPERGPGGKP